MNDYDFAMALDFLGFLEKDGLTAERKIERAFHHAERVINELHCSQECRDTYDDAMTEIFDSSVHADVVSIVREAAAYVLRNTNKEIRKELFSCNAPVNVIRWNRICDIYDNSTSPLPCDTGNVST